MNKRLYFYKESSSIAQLSYVWMCYCTFCFTASCTLYSQCINRRPIYLCFCVIKCWYDKRPLSHIRTQGLCAKTQEQLLVDALFADYNPMVRPVFNASDKVQVDLEMKVIQVDELVRLETGICEFINALTQFTLHVSLSMTE